MEASNFIKRMRYILILLYLLLGLAYFLIAKNFCAPEEPATESAVVADSQEKIPCPPIKQFHFNWSSDVVETSDKWNSYIDELKQGMNETSKIRITGLYVNTESNNTSFDNLGLARANSMAQLIGLESDKYQIAHDSFRSVKYGTDCQLPAAQLRVVTVSEKIKEIVASTPRTNNGALASVRTLIYFPVNSVNKLADEEVEAYLDKLIIRVLESGERIALEGHADNSGEADYNMELGTRRANTIKQYLLSKNVNPDMISTKSFGDSKPIASNDTEEGRAENRRTELRIINE